jgi:hypothetical protein
MNFDIWLCFENLLRKLQFLQNLTRTTVTSHEDQYTFLIISRSFLLRMRNALDRSCRGNQNTLFMFNNIIFPKIVPLAR